ncbi:ligase-associated DNA damage response endonuclease PdeM [Olivibacter sp. SDN3]|uniref:ligase-associated DNA damage response endonuclease PdeM n=1 Tax=Olivibacter sp. SDN3 TaxID=2764720 RepID=UPI0016510A5E|nr:ligase-associated DNA damage response endonuclease PdeM [Olivibacter sp. SDN3]QNL50847.1 ligase-associated DNA damage response endonuclease PdeM [Olivibacter sp. SDN3]
MNEALHTFFLGGKTVYLLPEKCIFLPENATLVLADIHLGKAAHFRKSGIIIPANAGTLQDYAKLHRLISKYQPKRILFLGDLFHSDTNKSWQHFLDFFHLYPQIKLILVRGNHDILPENVYQEANLALWEEQLEEEFIIYSHAPLAAVPSGMLNIAGHVHPATILTGKGKQKLRLPCFHYQPPLFLLPAFGDLTGTFILPKGNAKQFVVTNKSVVAL